MATTINTNFLRIRPDTPNNYKFEVQVGGTLTIPNRAPSGTTLSNVLVEEGDFCYNTGRFACQFLGPVSTLYQIDLEITP